MLGGQITQLIILPECKRLWVLQNRSRLMVWHTLTNNSSILSVVAVVFSKGRMVALTESLLISKT